MKNLDQKYCLKLNCGRPANKSWASIKLASSKAKVWYAQGNSVSFPHPLHDVFSPRTFLQLFCFTVGLEPWKELLFRSRFCVCLSVLVGEKVKSFDVHLCWLDLSSTHHIPGTYNEFSTVQLGSCHCYISAYQENHLCLFLFWGWLWQCL